MYQYAAATRLMRGNDLLIVAGNTSAQAGHVSVAVEDVGRAALDTNLALDSALVPASLLGRHEYGGELEEAGRTGDTRHNEMPFYSMRRIDGGPIEDSGPLLSSAGFRVI